MEPINDYREEITGLCYVDMEDAYTAAEGHSKVKKILSGKTVVGHSLYGDFKAMK